MPNRTISSFLESQIDGKLDTILVCLVDLQGRLMGKRFHSSNFMESSWKGSHFCNYLLATDVEMEPVYGYDLSSWDGGYGDFTVVPDLNTFRPAAWLDKTGLVLCDVYDHHGKELVNHSPREILKRQMADLASMGFYANAATELEFFIFDNSYKEMQEDQYRTLKPISAYNEDYHILQTTKEESIMQKLRNSLVASNVPVEGSKGEAETGQEELNIRYGSALDCADYHTIAKHAAKEIAWQNNKAISFMAKWHPNKVGASTHIHISLSKEESQFDSAFYDENKELGMSEIMQHFLGGLLNYCDDYIYFLAPNVNSYKRFKEGSFAPTRKVWSIDNRTAAFRICEDSSSNIRIECRMGGADLNPYLALAAMIAAGNQGIKDKIDPGKAHTGDAYKSDASLIPNTLPLATDRLRNSTMLKDAFGEDVMKHYVRAATWEQEEFDKAVTDWELRRNFERG